MRPMPIVGYAQGSGPAAYFMRAMHFDGASTALFHGEALAATPDSYIGTISMWVRIDTSVSYGPTDGIWGTPNRNFFLGVTTNAGPPFLWFQLNDGTNSFVANAAAGSLLNNQWCHVLISWNTQFPAGQKQIAIYVNGVSQLGTVTDASPAFPAAYQTLGYSSYFGNWSLGGLLGRFIKGDIADFMMWTNLDIAQSGGTIFANDIANFIRAGAPLPTRIAVGAYGPPTIRFAGDAATFPTNQGTGGVFQLQGAVSNGLYAPFDLDFTTSPYPAGVLTTTRASVGYAADLSGNWTSFAANTPRITNQGLLVEEGRTNSTRNNSMQGAVAGTPGTLPTNWSFINGPGSLSTSVVGTGTFNGVDYIDIRLFGTSNQTVTRIAFDLANAAAAANGQTWTSSQFFQMVGGSFANIVTCGIEFFTYNSGQTLLTLYGATISTQAVQPLSWARYASTNTIADATAAFVRQCFEINYTNGAAVDITLRIGWPQLEQGAFVTSPIRTTAAAATRAADVVTVTTPPAFGSAYSLFAMGTPNAPASYTNPQSITQIDPGVVGNRLTLRKNAINALATTTWVGGTGGVLIPGTWVQGVLGKLAVAARAGDQAAAFNGGAPVTSTLAALPTTPSNIGVGNELGGAPYWNGYITRVAVWPTARLPNSYLTSITT